MKTKFFTLFAAFVLLFSAQASAQVNGDVNDDGKVNEQDIAAILEIMAEAGGVKEQTKYYWYVGQTQPTADNYTTLEGIQQVTDYPTTFEYTNNSGKRGYAYVILHNSKTLTAVEKVSQATVNFTTDTSIPNYTIYKSTAGMAINGVMVITVNEKQTEDTKYYWYVGNSEDIVKGDLAAGDIDWSKAQQVTSFDELNYSIGGTKITMVNSGNNSVYILCPKSWSNKWQFWNVNNDIDLTTGFQEVGAILEKTFTNNNVEYDLWWLDGYYGNNAHMRKR